LETPTILAFLSRLQDSAPAAAPGGAATAPSFLSGSIIPLVLVLAVFYFVLILPERKKQKQRQKMLDALKKGDRVMTSSGMYGTVISCTNEIVVLQAADNVRLRFARSSIQAVITEEKETAADEKAEVASKA